MFRSFSLMLFGLWMVSSATSMAQNKVSDESASDLVVDMLDSLVNLNNVIRYQELNSTSGDSGLTDRPNTYPQYSDQVYTQRISKIHSPIKLTYNEQVAAYIDLYAYKRRNLTSRVMGLSQLYFPLFEETLDRESLPLELKYLAIVESALNPTAVSRVGATGLWQFMYNTGKLYGLKVNSYYDERRDPISATNAACQYFKNMYDIYHDWLLVIAAYNCGPGNVNKAIRRAGGKTDFWEISPYLPKETRGYVPAFIAVCYVMNYSAEHYIFPVLPAYNYFEVDTVSVSAGISLYKISQAIDIPIDVLTYLNPVYKRGVIPASNGEEYLRLPVNKISDYLDAEETLFKPLLAETSNQESIVSDNTEDRPFTYEYKKVRKTYVVRSGDNLSAIASRSSCSVNDLKSWNKLRSDMITPGQRLAVYRTEKVKVYSQSVDLEAAKPESATEDKSAIKPKVQENDIQIKVVYHMVEKGDTLWNIAKRYDGATVEQIMELNSIKDSKSLKPGTRIKVKVNG